jgi:tetratricopeptide (TPR) repeat protein
MTCVLFMSCRYSEVRAQFMEATAREYAGAIDQALVSYRGVIASGDTSFSVEAALAGSELLLQQKRVDEALEMLDEQSCEKDSSGEALVACARGWVLFEQGDIANAQKTLESILPKIPPTNVAARGRAFKRLAVVYWNLGGSFRVEKAYCFGHLLQAAKLVPSDSETFAWLGKWYHEVAKDVVRAEKCFLKALSLFPRNELAGVELSDLYAAQGKNDLNVKLWEDATAEQEHAPTWALLRLAQHLVDEDNELAVGKLHLALRNDPLNATYWVALAHVYAHFGKQVSAHKSYLKAMELGEDGWCVRLELARIEGALHLFEDALSRIAPVIEAMSTSGVDTNVDRSAVSMVYADLLFREAKSLCADGLYGRAASNLLKASRVMQELPSSSMVASSPEALKLIGDLHSFAFYLSPPDFNTEGPQGWVEFISEGRRAYKSAVAIIEKRPEMEKDQQSRTHVAELYYDIGSSCWYEALATANTHSIYLDAFTCEPRAEEEVSKAQKLRQEAVVNFQTALQRDPALALAWNGLALAHTSVLVKQFAWTRAIQASNHEAAWANLGMFYLAQCDALPAIAATLAQRSFLQLQSVNPDNPAMWNGYAMLARRQSHSSEQRVKAIEAFSCALKNGMDLDALLGLALLLQEKQNGDSTLISDGGHSDEEILFYLQKYLERDPFHPGAWNSLGVVQQRLGLHSRASASFTRASRIAGSKDASTKAGLEWNEHVAAIGAATAHTGPHEVQKQSLQYLIDATQTKALKKSSAQANALVLTAILKAQQHHTEGNWTKCQDTLQQILYLELEALAPNVVSGVGVIGLALSALAMENTANRTSAVELASSFTKLILDNSSAPELQADQQIIELYERFHGGYGSFLVRSIELKAGNPLRLGLAMVDASILSIKTIEGVRNLANYATPIQTVSPGKATADATTLQVLASIYFSNPESSVSDGMKLVRMYPWDPFSYLVAGVGLLKHVRCESDSERREASLTQLVRLLDAGHQCAIAAQSELDLAKLELLFAFCYSAKGDDDRAKEHGRRGLKGLEALITSTKDNQASRVPLLLIRARLRSVVDPKAAVLEYQDVVRVLSEMSEAGTGSEALVARAALTATLFEFGEFYEEVGELDGAIQVWRLLTNSVFSPDATPSEDSPAPEVSGVNPGFLANLRLALVHARKRNAKPAKKHIKAALSLAGDDTSDASTVAAFVESVLAG